MAAEVMAKAGIGVEIFDAMPSVGRKFLLAGLGGLNLTHSEPLERFVTRYAERAPDVASWLERFSPDDMRAWAAELGIETFVGSSGRVFPVQMKASPLLRAWLRRLDGLGVTLHTRHRWVGFDRSGMPLVRTTGGDVISVTADATVLALGGASWPKLGSDGSWAGILQERGIIVRPLRPANAGSPWHGTRASSRNTRASRSRTSLSASVERPFAGLMLTRTGIEGSAIYALSAALRDAIDRDGEAVLTLDLRPQLSATQVGNACAGLAGRNPSPTGCGSQ